MGIIAWIIFDLIAGIIAKLIMPGRDEQPANNTIKKANHLNFTSSILIAWNRR